jgi:catechol 2,3-dioxygenase-like lactoylglutathione lyase family enzyme
LEEGQPMPQEPVAIPKASAVYELVPMAHVADVEQSIRFYALLGFRVRERIPPAGRPHWAWLTAGRGHLMLAAAGEPVTPAQQAILLYLYTEDVVGLRAHLLASGVADGGAPCGAAVAPPVVYAVTHPPYMQEGEIRVADPDGYCLLIGQCELRTE